MVEIIAKTGYFLIICWIKITLSGHFVIEGSSTEDPQEIANKFNDNYIYQPKCINKTVDEPFDEYLSFSDERK